MMVPTASMISKAMVFIDLSIALHDHSASAHDFEGHGLIAWHAGKHRHSISAVGPLLPALQLGMSQQA